MDQLIILVRIHGQYRIGGPKSGWEAVVNGVCIGTFRRKIAARKAAEDYLVRMKRHEEQLFAQQQEQAMNGQPSAVKSLRDLTNPKLVDFQEKMENAILVLEEFRLVGGNWAGVDSFAEEEMMQGLAFVNLAAAAFEKALLHQTRALAQSINRK